MSALPESRIGGRSRIPATCLIAVSVGLQIVASTRVLSPPRSWVRLAWLRVAAAPRLWPFVDYPMFSSPHPRGTSVSWVDARVREEDGALACTFSHAVDPLVEDGSTNAAFERIEHEVRAQLEPDLRARHRSLVFERHRVLLAERGLVAVDLERAPDVESAPDHGRTSDGTSAGDSTSTGTLTSTGDSASTGAPTSAGESERTLDSTASESRARTGRRP